MEARSESSLRIGGSVEDDGAESVVGDGSGADGRPRGDDSGEPLE